MIGLDSLSVVKGLLLTECRKRKQNAVDPEFTDTVEWKKDPAWMG